MTNQDLHKHMSKIHLSFKCDLCDMMFGNESNLNKHMKTDHKKMQSDRTLRKITCFKNIEKCEFLPAIAVTNVRSLGPKVNTFIQDFKLRELSIACLTETWGKDDKLIYRKKILKMVHMEGLGILSRNRKTQRGGGVAIVYDSHVIDIQELNVIVPYNIEIVWRIGRPKNGKSHG